MISSDREGGTAGSYGIKRAALAGQVEQQAVLAGRLEQWIVLAKENK